MGMIDHDCGSEWLADGIQRVTSRMIDSFSSGYMQRMMPLLPKQGDRPPWVNLQTYRADRRLLLEGEIDDGVMLNLKVRAAREGRTMSELVETALRRLLEERPVDLDLPPLPVMTARERVDVSDRDALYRAMEEP